MISMSLSKGVQQSYKVRFFLIGTRWVIVYLTEISIIALKGQ